MTPTSALRMSIHFPLLFRRSLTALATLAFFLSALATRCDAVADNALTQQIWKLKYGVTDADLGNAAWLDADNDKDGLKNRDEIAAGTNPLSSGSVVRITTSADAARSTARTGSCLRRWVTC